jgi:hypothetical protein
MKAAARDIWLRGDLDMTQYRAAREADTARSQPATGRKPSGSK